MHWCRNWQSCSRMFNIKLLYGMDYYVCAAGNFGLSWVRSPLVSICCGFVVRHVVSCTTNWQHAKMLYSARLVARRLHDKSKSSLGSNSFFCDWRLMPNSHLRHRRVSTVDFESRRRRRCEHELSTTADGLRSKIWKMESEQMTSPATTLYHTTWHARLDGCVKNICRPGGGHFSSHFVCKESFPLAAWNLN